MISTDISISARVEEGADFDVVLFDRMLVHQDDWGRMIGEPGKVKARLRPLARPGPARFEKGIRLYAQLGLICWYQVNGRKYVALKPESCEEYQTGIHEKAVGRNRSSQYPAPPDPAFRWPEDGPVPTNPELSGTVLDGPAEHNTTQPNTTQHNTRTSSSPSSDLTPDQKKDHTAAMAAFDEGMKRLTELERPVGWRKSDKGHAARFFKECLLEKDTGEDLLACIAEFFARHKGFEERALADGKERHTAPSFARFRSSYLSLMRAVEAERKKRDAREAH